MNVKLGKAGYRCRSGIRLTMHVMAMNPDSHPLGCGEGAVKVVSKLVLRDSLVKVTRHSTNPRLQTISLLAAAKRSSYMITVSSSIKKELSYRNHFKKGSGNE